MNAPIDVLALPLAFGYRLDDGSIDVTTCTEKAQLWAKYAEDRVFGLYLNREPGVDELLAAAMVALQYLEHPDVREMPFSLPADAAAERLRAALANVSGGAA